MACAPSFLEASLLLQWWCLRATVLLSRSFGGAVAAVCPDDAPARACHREAATTEMLFSFLSPVGLHDLSRVECPSLCLALLFIFES